MKELKMKHYVHKTKSWKVKPTSHAPVYSAFLLPRSQYILNKWNNKHKYSAE